MSIPILRRRLRLPRHRATTAHLSSAYPFLAETGLGARGVYMGTNVLTGGGGFAYDPFEAYNAGTITNPNILIAGEPGVGKSATAKVFIYRSVGVFGRWVAIADPKGEYLPLADALGLDVIKLHPGGTARINPLDPGPAGLVDGPDELARRQATMVAALVGSVLRRDLTPVEDAVLGWAVEQRQYVGHSPPPGPGERHQPNGGATLHRHRHLLSFLDLPHDFARPLPELS